MTKVLLTLLSGLFSPLCWGLQEQYSIAETKIVGVTDAEPGRLPYFVSLVDGNNINRCGGTLIASNLVLTAASCSSVLG